MQPSEPNRGGAILPQSYNFIFSLKKNKKQNILPQMASYPIVPNSVLLEENKHLNTAVAIYKCLLLTLPLVCP